MARIDWAVVCDMAFFDRHQRLCIIGITRKLVFPDLPVGIHQLMLVAHLADDLGTTENIVVRVDFVAPNGMGDTVAQVEATSLQVVEDYVLVTLRDMRFVEEGTYRFGLVIGEAQPFVVEIPVWTYSTGTKGVH